MKQRLFAVCLVTAVLAPAFASANPEPTTYDSRSIAMGLTGTSYLERPAALVLNPANLEGIDKFGFTFNFSALLVTQWAPVQGPNTRVDSGLGFGPLPAIFVAGRIAPRGVFGGGIYIETGYGSDFANVTCLDGDVVGPAPEYEPATLDSDPRCTQADPQDLNVTFFVGEVAVGTSIRVTDKFWLGVALRLPFSKQVADLWQNVGAALGFKLYDRVKNDLGGVGFPSPRFGFTWKPHRKITIGAMYRFSAATCAKPARQSIIATARAVSSTRRTSAATSSRSSWNTSYSMSRPSSSDLSTLVSNPLSSGVM